MYDSQVHNCRYFFSSEHATGAASQGIELVMFDILGEAPTGARPHSQDLAPAVQTAYQASTEATFDACDEHGAIARIKIGRPS